jgi:hypothetical protein
MIVDTYGHHRRVLGPYQQTTIDRTVAVDVELYAFRESRCDCLCARPDVRDDICKRQRRRGRLRPTED